MAITLECRQAFSPWSDPLFLSGRSAPRAGVPACCGLHGCLCHRLGCHVQRACSVRGVDGPPTALARQLPRVASSTPCPGPPERAVTGQACAGPYGQYCDRRIHQPSRGSALPSHVTTLPPSPPLESEASEVASRHSCPWCAQPCGQRALTSCAAGRVATPSPGGPADLGRVREAQVDLFASPETSHYQLFYSLSGGTLSTDALTHNWPGAFANMRFPQ